MSPPSIAVACHGLVKSFGKGSADSASKAALGDTASVAPSSTSRSAASKTALNNVSFTIEAGEKVALLGANGAGKTTLLNLCAGLEPASQGALQIFGRNPLELRRRQRAQLVGLMPQRLNLVGPLRVRHNIQAGLLGRWGIWSALAALSLPVEVPAARDLASQLGLADKLAQRTLTLSGGEQQRTAAARLLLQHPRLMLADEPVASLDIYYAELLLGLLTQDESQTVLMSLHTPVHALKFATRIIGLRQGGIAFDALPSEVSQTQIDQLYQLPDPAEPADQSPAA